MLSANKTAELREYSIEVLAHSYEMGEPATQLALAVLALSTEWEEWRKYTERLEGSRRG